MSKASILDLNTGQSSPQQPICKSSVETFHLFRELPTELRLRIWRLAYVGLRLRIDMKLPTRSSLPGWNFEFKEKSEDIEWSQMLPTTLYVNRESREETLRHGTLVIRPSVSNIGPTDLLRFPGSLRQNPIFFTPSVDSVYIMASSLHNKNWKYWPALLSYLDRRQLITKIECLEVRDVSWWIYVYAPGRTSSIFTAEQRDFLVSVLSRFTHLQKVIFVAQYESNGHLDYATQPPVRKGFRELLETTLEPHGSKWERGRAPEVIVESWKKLTEEARNFE